MGSFQLGAQGPQKENSLLKLTDLNNPPQNMVMCPLSKKITLPSKDNVSLFAISGDGAVVTFTVTRPEVRKDHVRLLTDSDIESSFSKYRK